MKTAIIREVVPRCYVEICLCKCYIFLSSKPITDTLERVAASVRGVSESLAAIYMCVYIAKIGAFMVPREKRYLFVLYENIYHIMEHAKARGFPNISI